MDPHEIIEGQPYAFAEKSKTSGFFGYSISIAHSKSFWSKEGKSYCTVKFYLTDQTFHTCQARFNNTDNSWSWMSGKPIPLSDAMPEILRRKKAEETKIKNKIEIITDYCNGNGMQHIKKYIAPPKTKSEIEAEQILKDLGVV